MHQLPLTFEPTNPLELRAANDAAGHEAPYVARKRDPFYRSKGWQRAKAVVFARDGAICRIDGMTARDGVRLDVDHIVPRVDAPHLALMPSNLQVLCEHCHQAKTYRDQVRRWREQKRAHRSA